MWLKVWFGVGLKVWFGVGLKVGLKGCVLCLDLKAVPCMEGCSVHRMVTSRREEDWPCTA